VVIAELVSIVIAARMQVHDPSRVPLSFPTYAGAIGRLAATATRQLNLMVKWEANQAAL
jgi:dihydrolipoamide dehydrogenase